MAEKLAPSARELLLIRLEARGVTMLTGVKYENISEKGLTITTKEGERKTLEADTIVLAAGSTPNNELAATLKDKVARVLSIGDCVEPRTIMEAVQEGYMAGLAI